MGLTAYSDQVWIWGIQGYQTQLLHFNPASSKIQGRYAAPNNWQVSGLAGTDSALIVSPKDPNPPGPAKALLGLHPDSGNVSWELAISGFMFTPPAADQDLACAVDSNGSLIAVKPSSGEATWNLFPQLGDYPHRGIPPVLSRDHVLAVESEAGGAGLDAFHRANGEKAWAFQPPDNATVDFAPAVWGDSAFVLAGEWLYRVALADGTWIRLSRSQRKSSQGWYFASPVVNEENVYLLEAGYFGEKNSYSLHTCDAATGRSLWRMELDRRPRQPPAVDGEHVYFVNRDGMLSCLKRTDGKIVWQEALSDEPACAPVVIDRSVLVLTRDAALHISRPSTSALDISQPPASYDKQGEWGLAAGAYLASNQPFEAGLALLQIPDYRQAALAFDLADHAGQRMQDLIQKLLLDKKDAQAGELCEGWGMIMIEQMGEQSQGDAEVARWFEKAAENFMLANQTLDAMDCREHAAQVMETPRIKLDVLIGGNDRWTVNESLLLHIHLTNFGYGPARRINIKIGGNIRKPHPSQSFTDIAVDQTQRWENVRITPNRAGAGLLEFNLDYESYRTGKVQQTKFTHPILVGKNQDEIIRNAVRSGAALHIEKFFSPGATHNEIEITDSQGIAIGEKAQTVQTPNPTATKYASSSKETKMDTVTLIVSALLAGLTAGLTDTAKAATKDLYDTFKARLLRNAETSADAQDAIKKIEKQPDSKARQDLLKEELAKLPLERDEELIKLAQSLMEALKDSGGTAGKYSVDIQNSQGIVVGDHASVTQNFGTPQEKQNKATG